MTCIDDIFFFFSFLVRSFRVRFRREEEEEGRETGASTTPAGLGVRRNKDEDGRGQRIARYIRRYY